MARLLKKGGVMKRYPQGVEEAERCFWKTFHLANGLPCKQAWASVILFSAANGLEWPETPPATIEGWIQLARVILPKPREGEAQAQAWHCNGAT